MNGFDHLEALAEQLVEGTFDRLFQPRLHSSEVARRLARAMEDGQLIGDQGQAILPDRYWVFLNPDDFTALDAGGERLHAELISYLQRLAAGTSARFGGQLRVALHPVDDLKSGQLAVRAAHGGESGNASDTRGLRILNQSAADASRWTLRVGERLFPLGEPVIRLGRALSNDIILNDRRVSRRHAQLRWRGGSYRLSDMGSQGGTLLNGRPVQQGEECSLSAGDLISLAGVTLNVQMDNRQAGIHTQAGSSLPAHDP